MRTSFNVFTWAVLFCFTGRKATKGCQCLFYLPNRESIYERKPFDAQKANIGDWEAIGRGACQIIKSSRTASLAANRATHLSVSSTASGSSDVRVGPAGGSTCVGTELG